MKRSQIPIYLGLVTVFLGNISCDKIKNKKHQLRQSIRQFTFDKKDQVFPGFDSGKPDTESNKRRFRDFLGVAPTSDVKNIYCYSDRVGIDASFAFVFECNSSTHQAIINELHLEPDTAIVDFGSGGFGTDEWWWNKQIPAKVKPHSRKQGDLYWYLWRDEKNSKDYFLTYDM